MLDHYSLYGEITCPFISVFHFVATQFKRLHAACKQCFVRWVQLLQDTLYNNNCTEVSLLGRFADSSDEDDYDSTSVMTLADTGLEVQKLCLVFYMMSAYN